MSDDTVKVPRLTIERARIVCESAERVFDRLRSDYLEANEQATENGVMPVLLADRRDFAAEVREELTKAVKP